MFVYYQAGPQQRRGQHVCRATALEERLHSKAAKDVSVLVVGPTGYIGRFVVKELIHRGYQVTVFAREKSGVKGKNSKEQTIKVCHFCL